MTLAVTRPENDAHGVAEALILRGHTVVMAPLLAIVPRPNVRLAHASYQAIAVTSANGPRSLGRAVRNLNLDTPVFAVGQQSQLAAKALGFRDVTAVGGDVDGMFAHLRIALSPSGGPILYLSGAETSGDLEGKLRSAGFGVERVICYDAVPLHLDAQCAAVAGCNGVLLYSPRTAKLWLAECARLKLDLSAKLHFCLSPRVAQALPPNTHISIASAPHDAALLALLDLASEAE